MRPSFCVLNAYVEHIGLCIFTRLAWHGCVYVLRLMFCVYFFFRLSFSFAHVTERERERENACYLSKKKYIYQLGNLNETSMKDPEWYVFRL